MSAAFTTSPAHKLYKIFRHVKGRNRPCMALKCSEDGNRIPKNRVKGLFEMNKLVVQFLTIARVKVRFHLL